MTTTSGAPIFDLLTEVGSSTVIDARHVERVQRLRREAGISGVVAFHGSDPTSVVTEDLVAQLEQAAQARDDIADEIAVLEQRHRELSRAGSRTWLLLGVLLVIVLAVVVGQLF